MSEEREYSGVILKCCGHQQKIKTTPQEEIALDAIGKVSKSVVCNSCGAKRFLEIRRDGSKTTIGDRTEDIL